MPTIEEITNFDPKTQEIVPYYPVYRNVQPQEVRRTEKTLSPISKMLHNDNIIRPRKSTWVNTASHDHKLENVSIFKISELFERRRSIFHPKEPKEHGHKSSTKKILQHIENYCEKSTLHGLRYVGDSTLTFCERVFWLCSFFTAACFAAYYISNIYVKWNQSPVIISFSPFDADLNSVPFPSITICNMNQAKRSEAEKILQNGSYIERKLLNDYCNGNNSFNNSLGETSWETLQSYLINVGQSCTDMLKVCKWRQDNIDCEENFNNDLTDEGLCCSFNRLPPRSIYWNPKSVSYLNQTYPDFIYDWSPERGFPDKVTGDTNQIPRRPLGSGVHMGLTLVLDAQTDNYFCSSTNSIGFKIILSNPIETPKIADFGFLVSPGNELRIGINPTIREATDSLRNVPIEKRACYFSSERILKYYRIYTERNCKLECQSNYTLSLCDCIPYFLPKAANIKICGKTDEICSNDAKENMELIYGNGSSCHCLPGCFEINYEKSMSASSIYNHSKNIASFVENFSKNVAILHFFFEGNKFTKQVKSELYSFTDLLSNTGGLLGLCLGFSLLSLVEIIYFFIIETIRSQCKKHKKILSQKRERSPLPYIQ